MAKPTIKTWMYFGACSNRVVVYFVFEKNSHLKDDAKLQDNLETANLKGYKPQ